jgi:hypothetical protein
MSGKALIGTLLGAAAGATFAYAMMRSESPEDERMAMPANPTGRVLSYVQGTPSRSYSQPRRNVAEHAPARTLVSERSASDARSRYVGPQYTLAAPPARDLERIEEGSYISSHHPSRASRHTTRSRSQDEGSRYGRPLTILPAPTPRDRSPTSHVSHRSHRSGSSGGSGGERRSSVSKKDESYHSARSTHTESTIKPARSAVTASPSVMPSKAGSKTTTIKLISPNSRSDAGSRASEYITPRSSEYGGRSEAGRSKASIRPSQVELPRSMVSGRGYAESVAPSDSVSSVGEKRERERLKERMRERGSDAGRW